MSGAQALVAQLLAEGVEAVFTLPGVQIMHVYDALQQAQPQIRLIQTRHEQATTYMADGYARTRGKPGLALVVPGPGALNAAAGLGTAYASSSPVLLISGQIPSAALGCELGMLHEIHDQLDIFRPLTKWNRRIEEVKQIPAAVHRAFEQLKTGRPRPVELEIPPDVLAAVDEVKILDAEEYPPAAAESDPLKQAAELLLCAQNPVILAGGGAAASQAGEVLLALAERLQAPITLTAEAKGVISEEHPLCVGCNFAYLGAAYRVLPASDVILAVGTRFLFRDLELRETQQIIQIDADARVIGKNYPARVALVADARTALGQLLERLGPADPPPSRLPQIAEYRRAFQKELEALAPRQLEIIHTLRRHLTPEAIVVAGMTNIGYWSHLAFPVLRPRTYLTPSYFGTLGFAYPTALGAAVAHPECQVVALCGDGGFLYNAQEMATASKYGLRVLAIVFNNEAFGASQWDQTHRFQGRYLGTDLCNPDFVKLAEAFGLFSLRTAARELGPALEEALSVQRPALLEVTLPNMMPPFHLVPNQS